MIWNIVNGIQQWPSDADFFETSKISATVAPTTTTTTTKKPDCKDKKNKKKCNKGKKKGKCTKKGFAKKCKKTCNVC